MLDIFTKRTSCRSYLPKEIELEKINQLKQAINASPTACNFQDFSCIFITDKAMLDKLCLYSNNQSHVKQAPLFIAFYADQNRPNSTIK
jgi:nitroreductase